MKKGVVMSVVGVGGSFISYLLGGIDSLLLTLIIFMMIDYISGLLVGAVFHNSPKTKNGGLESKASYKGLVRKFMIFLLVGMGNRLDVELGMNYCRNAVCFAFIANETLSIIENMGLMGIPIPSVITNAIELLKEKGEQNNEL